MKRDAEFSECGKYRYWLSRIWDEEKPNAMCIGLNPSTANGTEDDTTITNLTELLKGFGYGGFYMLNLFAFISPDPDKLREVPDPVKDNDLYLAAVSGQCKDIIFAWGSFKQAEYRAAKVAKMFPGALCLGKTAKGKPLHPMAATIWMRSKCKLQPFFTGRELELKK